METLEAYEITNRRYKFADSDIPPQPPIHRRLKVPYQKISLNFFLFNSHARWHHFWTTPLLFAKKKLFNFLSVLFQRKKGKKNFFHNMEIFDGNSIEMTSRWCWRWRAQEPHTQEMLHVGSCALALTTNLVAVCSVDRWWFCKSTLLVQRLQRRRLEMENKIFFD